MTVLLVLLATLALVVFLIFIMRYSTPGVKSTKGFYIPLACVGFALACIGLIALLSFQSKV